MAGYITEVDQIFDQVRRHDFHPIKDGFTYDKNLDEHGVADLNDRDWEVRTFAARDLVKQGDMIGDNLTEALNDPNEHVRHIAAKVLGIIKYGAGVESLTNTLLNDDHEVVRAQAAVSLWQIGDKRALEALKKSHENDESKDVRHQAELAIHALENGYSATDELKKTYKNIDESSYDSVEVGKKAPDFSLPDTDGNEWRLSDQIGEKPIVLIWIFADWCPVCHNEFSELIEMREELKDDIAFATLECHDEYPARVMVGKEFEPEYWFSDESFYDEYARKIWWPHLVDRAGLVGTEYGVQPMAFTVHAEWINRPAVVIIDEEGIVRYTYYGTYWGDRPTIHDIKEMIETGEYNFESSDKLKT